MGSHFGCPFLLVAAERMLEKPAQIGDAVRQILLKTRHWIRLRRNVIAGGVERNLATLKKVRQDCSRVRQIELETRH